jgi:hypothetical protein
MGGAELDRETTETVAGVARFGGHILGTPDVIRPDLAAAWIRVPHALYVAAARSLRAVPIFARSPRRQSHILRPR